MNNLATRFYRARHFLFGFTLFAIIVAGLAALSEPCTWDQGKVPDFFPDRILYVVQLFLVETPEGLARPRSPYFQLVFLAANLFTFTAALQLVSSAFPQFWNGYVARWFLREHRIVCGTSRKGVCLARVFRDAGHRVVVIERDATRSEIKMLREEGFRVYIGDATTPRVLLDARIECADSVYLACPDDENLRIVRTLEEMAVQQGAPQFPPCHVHIWDRHLYEELENSERHCRIARQAAGSSNGQAATASPIQVNYHSVAALAGAKLPDWRPAAALGTPPLLSGKRDVSDHFVVIGVGAIGLDFIVGTTRRWARMIGEPKDCVPPTFHLVDLRADEWKAELEAEHAGLRDHWHLVAHKMEVPSAAFTRLISPPDSDNDHPISEPRRIVVALPSDAANVAVGLTLLRLVGRLRWHSTLIIARIAEEAGVMWCDALSNNDTPLLQQFQPFNQLREALTVDFYLTASQERIAIALHEAYRRQVAEENQQRLAEGKPPFTLAEKPADVEWNALPVDYSESTLRQAAGIVQELANLPVPREIAKGPGPGDPLTPAEQEYLAEREHDRWMADRAAKGWKYGEKRDNDNKLHPDMLLWDRLPEASKEYDRKMVSAWPAALEQAGLIIRKKRSG